MLEPVVIKVPKVDMVDAVEKVTIVELDKVDIDTVVFSQETKVASKDAMSPLAVLDACEDREHIESDDEELV